MLQDGDHVFHGHMDGVTCYRQDGSRKYHVTLKEDNTNMLNNKAREASGQSETVQTAVLVGDHLYAASARAIQRIDRSTGRVTATFDKGRLSYIFCN